MRTRLGRIGPLPSVKEMHLIKAVGNHRMAYLEGNIRCIRIHIIAENVATLFFVRRDDITIILMGQAFFSLLSHLCDIYVYNILTKFCIRNRSVSTTCTTTPLHLHVWVLYFQK